MPAHMVNAYYNPQKNLVVFPAAILQAFMSASILISQLRWYQAVIAHEISHAFDTIALPLMKMVALTTGGQA